MLSRFKVIIRFHRSTVQITLISLIVQVWATPAHVWSSDKSEALSNRHNSSPAEIFFGNPTWDAWLCFDFIQIFLRVFFPWFHATFKLNYVECHEDEPSHTVCLHQESQAAQRQILMEFLKEARRNKREVSSTSPSLLLQHLLMLFHHNSHFISSTFSFTAATGTTAEGAQFPWGGHQARGGELAHILAVDDRVAQRGGQGSTSLFQEMSGLYSPMMEAECTVPNVEAPSPAPRYRVLH